jgi:hypothetical protein
MRFWTGVTAAFGAGTLIGTVLGTLLVEKKLKAEYAESTASMRRAYEALKIDAETPALTEEDLIITHPTPEGTALEGGDVTILKNAEVHNLSLDAEPNAFGETIEVKPIDTDVVVKPTQSDNPYHTAVRQTAEQGGYVTYVELSAEDYDEDDGRLKEHITMLFSDGEPIFFKDSAELEVAEAMDLVGSTIVDDMRKSVREGNPIIYMRNAQTDIDYEVVFEQP